MYNILLTKKNLKKVMKALIPKKIARKLNFLFKKRARFEWEYLTGQWDTLKSPYEYERFNALVELTAKYVKGASILEVGSGEGLLLPKISAEYDYFMGIDISEIAITRANLMKSDKVAFVRADFEYFVPDSKFDVIIFNESLYYSKKPVEVMERYKSFLSGPKIFAISTHENKHGLRLVKYIHDHYDCLDSKTTKNIRGTWYCDVFRIP